MFSSKMGSLLRAMPFIFISLICLPDLVSAQPQLNRADELAVEFNGKYGQIEVGGDYAGAEFHDSRPVPSRISFYYPVANSIDLSTDYWKRAESRPFIITAKVDGKVDTIGDHPCEYSWTPYAAHFHYTGSGFKAEIAYQFCSNIPFMVVKIRFTNTSAKTEKFRAATSLAMTLRTCQTYAWRDTASVSHSRNGGLYVADFRYRDTDSASVIVANVGDQSILEPVPDTRNVVEGNPVARFSYSLNLRPSASFEIIQLVGSCRSSEVDGMVPKALRSWKENAERNQDRILDYVYRSAVINVPDKNLEHTALWSKAMLATDRHYINGSIVPMPCPAEYNFFFTHDVLLTDLGAVFYDLPRVKHDLDFIRSITHGDSILPHAYYWRDDGFKTEFAAADNWNHLWFMIVCGTYLKHSNDTATLNLLYPILKKSAEMALSNLGPGGLAYSTRPDWWDIGNNYGARSYLTALMVRALREFSYVALVLRKDGQFASSCLATSDDLQSRLEDKLWNSKVGYLLNTVDTNRVDYHYYAGSLVAVDFGVLSRSKSDSLLQTAQRELLDPNLGLRNAMPDNFDTLSSLYRFVPGEAGGPYVYMNGAVWPHTNAWYILALIELNHVNEAYNALGKFLSIGGIERSPHGQPSFYEYRFSDPGSSGYGRIDKPNFLWAGGWYLNCLYHLVGVRENEWNISLTPRLPDGFENVSYNLTSGGKELAVSWKGKGKYFRRISVDGKNVHSAIVLGKGKKIDVERGAPDSPYLAHAACVVDGVHYNERSGRFDITVEGMNGEKGSVTVISTKPIHRALIGGDDAASRIDTTDDQGVYTSTLKFVFRNKTEKVQLSF